MTGKLRLYGSTLCIVLILGCVQALADATPPAGAQLFESSSVPVPNTQFIFERPNGDRYTNTVSEDTSPFQGRAVYRTTNNRRRDTWDSTTHNLIAVHDGSGTLLRYYSPHESELDWPLWVGKSYRKRFQQVTVRARRSGDRVGSVRRIARVKVAAMETITTPAGTFDTMRIEFVVSGWRPITIWRARDIPVHVMLAIDGRTRFVLAEIRKSDREISAAEIDAGLTVSEAAENFCRGFDETFEGVWLNQEGKDVLRFRFATNADGNGCYAWLNPVEEWGIRTAGWENKANVEIAENARRWGSEENSVLLNIKEKSARFSRDGRETKGRLLD